MLMLPVIGQPAAVVPDTLYVADAVGVIAVVAVDAELLHV